MIPLADRTFLARVSTILLALGLSAGCSLIPGGGVDDPFAGGARDRPAELLVRNAAFNDATIWAVYSGERHRLGIASGKTDTRLTLPPRSFAEPVYLEIDFVGGDRCRTDTLVVDPGDILELDLRPEPSTMPECRRG